MKTKTIDTETLEAKLRNSLSPHYGLPSMILALEESGDKKDDLMKFIIDYAKIAVEKEKEISFLLKRIDENRASGKLDNSDLYGKYVQLNDEHKTAHLWNEILDKENNGVWTLTEISEKNYLLLRNNI